MLSTIRGFHLRLGDGPFTSRAADWLAAHAAETIHCDDAFEACAVMARGDGPLPDLVLLSIEWLRPEEAAIVEFARRAWPRARIIAYGAKPNPAAEMRDVSYCADVAELSTALAAVNPFPAAALQSPPIEPSVVDSAMDRLETIGPGPRDVISPSAVPLSDEEIAVLLGPTLR